MEGVTIKPDGQWRLLVAFPYVALSSIQAEGLVVSRRGPG